MFHKVLSGMCNFLHVLLEALNDLNGFTNCRKENLNIFTIEYLQKMNRLPLLTKKDYYWRRRLVRQVWL